jgi:hypothetical protein
MHRRRCCWRYHWTTNGPAPLVPPSSASAFPASLGRLRNAARPSSLCAAHPARGLIRCVKRSVVLIAAAATLAGCGKSTTAASRAEAHFAAAANPMCRDIKHQLELPFSPNVEGNLNAARSRFRALLRSEQTLPRVAILLSDIENSERLLAALFKKGVPLPGKRPYFRESRLVGAKIRSDLKALDLTACIPPARKPIGG